MNIVKIIITASIFIVISPLVGITFLVDGSGSMKGFANAGVVSNQVKDISVAASTATQNDRFILFRSATKDNVEHLTLSLGELDNPGSYSGKYTLLGTMADKLLAHAEPGIYVVLTDNVDDDGETKGNSKRFYDRLKGSDNIQSVDVIPRIINFAGNPYRGSKSYHAGKAGMLVYVITVGADKQIIKESGSLIQKLGRQGYAAFHIRPITSDHVQLNTPKGNRGKFRIYSRHGKYYLKVRNDQKGKPSPSLLVDRQNTVDFSVMMESHYPYIGIAKDTKVRIEDFYVTSPGVDLKLTKPKAIVTPSKFPEPLEEGGKQRFDARIHLKPVMPSFWERLSSMFAPRRGKVAFNMVLGTSTNSLYMIDEARNRFFTSQENDYDKIFSSVDIISHFNPQDNKIVFGIQNENRRNDPSTQVVIAYDNGFLFFLIVCILALLVFLIIMLYRYFKAPNTQYLSVEKSLTGETKVYEIGRFASIEIEPGTAKRKLSEVVFHIRDRNRFYFKDSIFTSIDLPPKVVREITERDSQNVYRMYIDTKRRKDV